jgi:hypothetical protein
VVGAGLGTRSQPSCTSRTAASGKQCAARAGQQQAPAIPPRGAPRLTRGRHKARRNALLAMGAGNRQRCDVAVHAVSGLLLPGVHTGGSRDGENQCKRSGRFGAKGMPAPAHCRQAIAVSEHRSQPRRPGAPNARPLAALPMWPTLQPWARPHFGQHVAHDCPVVVLCHIQQLRPRQDVVEVVLWGAWGCGNRPEAWVGHEQAAAAGPRVYKPCCGLVADRLRHAAQGGQEGSMRRTGVVCRFHGDVPVTWLCAPILQPCVAHLQLVVFR